MTIRDFVELTGAKILTPGVDVEREITCGYSCDLLSWVMSHGASGMAWITVQTHMNVIAVATLMDMAAVIVPEGISVDQEVVDKAAEEDIALIASGLTAYELCGRMYQAGVKAN